MYECSMIICLVKTIRKISFFFLFQRGSGQVFIDFESKNYFPEEKEIYQIGEQINKKIRCFLVSVIENDELLDII